MPLAVESLRLWRETSGRPNRRGEATRSNLARGPNVRNPSLAIHRSAQRSRPGAKPEAPQLISPSPIRWERARVRVVAQPKGFQLISPGQRPVSSSTKPFSSPEKAPPASRHAQARDLEQTIAGPAEHYHAPKPSCPQRNSRASLCRGLEDKTLQRSRSAHLPATGWRERLGRGGAMAVCSVFCQVPRGTMPIQSQDSPLGAFLKALREEKIDCMLIGAMAAIEQGAPLITVG